MINKILSKYEGFRDCWYPDVKEKNLYINKRIKKKYSKGCRDLECKLMEKWKSYIGAGWYGFSLGEPCPHDWYKIIDEFLVYLESLQSETKIEDLEILQIKIKMGGVRFGITFQTKDEELDEYIRLQIEVLERYCFDTKLIY